MKEYIILFPPFFWIPRCNVDMEEGNLRRALSGVFVDARKWNIGIDRAQY